MSTQSQAKFANPFRPGAGHMPPVLAGREEEKREFARLLKQDVILENMILTGLRGIGKTVLLETLKPMAMAADWLWVGTDLSESMSVNEESLSIRLLADLAVVTSGITVMTKEPQEFPLAKTHRDVKRPLDFGALKQIFSDTPGLIADKLKNVFKTVWTYLSQTGKHGVVFAYDEAQNLADHRVRDQYPLSLLLDAFQSIQRQNVPFMLVLTGLPTLFPKLVEARTYAERMFHLISLNKLDKASSREAILGPIKNCPVKMSNVSVDQIIEMSDGYPYFIQYVCREVYDIWVQHINSGKPAPSIPHEAILRKLDADFFAGRWARATDRQRDLLSIVADLPNCDAEFTVQEVVEASGDGKKKPFSSSHVNQMFGQLATSGLVYKNRHGKYSLAVPLLAQFIRRQRALLKEQPSLFE